MPASTPPKIVLVTGASSGIGAAVAREAARRGHRVALTARRADRLETLAGEIQAGGTEAIVIPADLTDPAEPERIVEETVERLGGLDVLINNAGFGIASLFADADPEALERQLRVNLTAPLLLARHALPHLFERRGTIINVGSAITSVANSALGAYGTTKAGLAYWNDALRRELRHQGVNVCLVEPGPIETEFFQALAAPPSTGSYNPLSDPPPRFLARKADEVARRIVRLINHPRRRLSVPRRVVWPFRLIGGVFQVSPWLGDVILSSIARRFITPHSSRGLDQARLPR